MNTDLHWFKSSYSGDQGECLEIAMAHATANTPTIHIRDSKTPTAPTLRVAAAAWAAFLPQASADKGNRDGSQ